MIDIIQTLSELDNVDNSTVLPISPQRMRQVTS